MKRMILIISSAMAVCGIASAATAQKEGGSRQAGASEAQENSGACYKSPQISDPSFAGAPTIDVAPSVPVPLLGGKKTCRLEVYARNPHQISPTWYEEGEANGTKFLVTYNQSKTVEQIAGYIGADAVPKFSEFRATPPGVETVCSRQIATGAIKCELPWSETYGIVTVTQIENGQVTEMNVDMALALRSSDAAVRITIGGQTIERPVTCDVTKRLCNIDLALPHSQAVTAAAIKAGSATITVVSRAGQEKVSQVAFPDLHLASKMQHQIAKALVEAQ